MSESNKKGITILSVVNFKVLVEFETDIQFEDYCLKFHELQSKHADELKLAESKKDKTLLGQLQREAVQYGLSSNRKTPLTEEQQEEVYGKFRPKCPTCGSPNVELIPISNKVMSAIFYGPFSIVRIAKTYQCKNCMMKW